jgi:hypothetical protein
MLAVLKKELDEFRSNKLLKSPASLKPSASSECRFPRQPIALANSVDVSYRHICQKNVAFGRVAVPSKHRVDTSLKLDSIGFVDIACVNPEILQAIVSSLFSAEMYLLVSNLVLPSAV